MLISNRCLHGLMANLIKKSVTVPIAEVTCPPQNMFTLDIQINKHCTLINSGFFFHPVIAFWSLWKKWRKIETTYLLLRQLNFKIILQPIFSTLYFYLYWGKFVPYQAMTEAAIFLIGRSRIIHYGKIRPLADYRSRSRLLNFKRYI